MRSVRSSTLAGPRRGGDVKVFGRPLAGTVATVCRERRPAVEALGPRGGWDLVGGGVATDREDGEDRGEFCKRVADERAVDVDHLEREPGGRALGWDEFHQYCP